MINELPFDSLVLAGGLQQQGRLIRSQRGRNVYGLTKYSDIEQITEKRWYVCVLNEQMDFFYVKLGIVQYYLKSRKPLEDFQPDSNVTAVNGVCVLVFRFVCTDGVKRQWHIIFTVDYLIMHRPQNKYF